MTPKQAETIRYVFRKHGFLDDLYLTDAKEKFTEEEIERCRNCTESSLTTPDAGYLLTLTRNIATWRKQVGLGMCDQWIKCAKQIIAVMR